MRHVWLGLLLLGIMALVRAAEGPVTIGGMTIPAATYETVGGVTTGAGALAYPRLGAVPVTFRMDKAGASIDGVARCRVPGFGEREFRLAVVDGAVVAQHRDPALPVAGTPRDVTFTIRQDGALTWRTAAPIGIGAWTLWAADTDYPLPEDGPSVTLSVLGANLTVGLDEAGNARGALRGPLQVYDVTIDDAELRAGNAGVHLTGSFRAAGHAFRDLKLAVRPDGSAEGAMTFVLVDNPDPAARVQAAADVAANARERRLTARVRATAGITALPGANWYLDGDVRLAVGAALTATAAGTVRMVPKHLIGGAEDPARQRTLGPFTGALDLAERTFTIAVPPGIPGVPEQKLAFKVW